MPSTVEGIRVAWAEIDRTWQATFARAARLSEDLVHLGVRGEWSFVETQRHLLFVTDVWVRRSVLDDPGAYHRLGMPPDHRTGQPDPDLDVSGWGIDVFARPALDEVLAARVEYLGFVSRFIDRVTPEELGQPSLHNPPWMPPTEAIPMSACLGVVVREEQEHHRFALRDLALAEEGLDTDKPDGPEASPDVLF